METKTRSNKKVGAVVLATDQGLGYLAKSFYDHGLINRVYIKKHSTRVNHYDWYPTEHQVDSPYDLLECDTILFFETPFYWDLIPKARNHSVKTVFMPMYECTQHPFPYEPDLILCPSDLDFKHYASHSNKVKVTVPVDVEWKQRTIAKTFVHNAGNGGLGGRNGTKELIQAMKYVKSPLMLLIRSQVDLGLKTDDERIIYHVGSIPQKSLWNTGDVFVFPEKFNGLSLPLQEAYAAGMLVVAGDRFPINKWLPRDYLIHVDHYVKERIAVEFESAVYTPEDIATAMDACYNLDISEFSKMGLEFNKEFSWKNPHIIARYKDLLSLS